MEWQVTVTDKSPKRPRFTPVSRLRNYRRAYAVGKTGLEAISRSVAGCKGHLKHGRTYRLQKNMWNNFRLKRKHPEEENNHENKE